MKSVNKMNSFVPYLVGWVPYRYETGGFTDRYNKGKGKPKVRSFRDNFWHLLV